MENVDFIISIIEGLIALATLVGLIWGCTKAFGVKGFILSLGGIILFLLAITGFEKFLDYAFDNAPILIVIFFAILAIYMLWIIFITVKENLTSGEAIKRKFIKDTIQQLKVLGLSLLGGAAIVGLIFWSVVSSNM